MLRLVVFILLISNGFIGHSQKVDIDNYWVPISIAALPDNYIPAEQRTYSLSLGGNNDYTGDDVLSRIRMFGWSVTEENPTLEIKTHIENFVLGKGISSKRIEEKKDKEGKVISSKTYYRMSSTNAGKGKLYIYGEKNSYSESLKKVENDRKEREKAMKEEKKRRKKKSKKDLEKEAKQKELESNPFLQDVELEVEGVETETDFGSPANSSRELVYTLKLDKDYPYYTSESTSSTKVNTEFRNGSINAYNRDINSYKLDLINGINYHLNTQYGFKPINENVKFKRLDSEDHPEFAMFDSATKAMHAIFGKMRYNQGIDQINVDLAPILAYYETTAKRLELSKDKHEKNLRAACYYNLAQSYYYLDQHDKVIEVGNQIINSKHDEKDGKSFIEKAEKMKRNLAFFNMTSRHIPSMNADESSDELGESVESEIENN